MPDSGEPSGVEVKVRDYCAEGRVHLRDLRFWGCTFFLKGNGLRVSNVSLMYPSYHRTIEPRRAAGVPGAIPAQTTLQGDDGEVSELWVRYAQNGGLKIVGSRNLIRESLFEDMTWLPSLDFPPLELGFTFANPTLAEDDERGREGAVAVGLGSTNAEAATVGATRHHHRTVWGGLHAVGVDPTFGNDNRVTRTTLRRLGEMGIVTSQRSNELSFIHVHDGGLIGLDVRWSRPPCLAALSDGMIARCTAECLHTRG
jgi:hypothetical protein